MATLDFPDAPTLGQIYSKWTWNGTMWVVTPVTGPAGPPAGRNLLHNGAFVLAQKNKSVGIGSVAMTTLTVDQFVTDRWKIIPMGNAAVYPSYKNNNIPGGSALVYERTAQVAAPAASDRVLVTQGVEGNAVQHLRWGHTDALPVTLSFWAMSGVNATYVAEITRAVGRAISATFSLVAGVWTKITITFPGDTAGGITADNNLAGLTLAFWLGAGSTYTSGGALQTVWGTTTTNKRAFGCSNIHAPASNTQMWFSQTQLEAGSVATPFDQLSFAEILAQAQRYLHVDNAFDAGLYHTFAVGSGKTTTVANLMYSLPVSMRAIPTLSSIGSLRLLEPGVGIGVTSIQDPGSNQMGSSGGMLEASVASGLTANRPYFLQASNDSTARIIYAAEI